MHTAQTFRLYVHIDVYIYHINTKQHLRLLRINVRSMEKQQRQ